MKVKRVQLAAGTILFVVELACAVMAVGWFRQLGAAGIARAVRSMRLPYQLPQGDTVALAGWPAQFQRATLAQAAAGWKEYVPRWHASIFGHTVVLPRQISTLALWGSLKSPRPLTMRMEFNGHGQFGAFRIPIRMESIGKMRSLPEKPFGTVRIPLMTEKSTDYGKPVPGCLAITWMHHLREQPDSRPRARILLVKPFRVFLPRWANSVSISWAGLGAGAVLPPIGFIASSEERHNVISATLIPRGSADRRVAPHSPAGSGSQARQVFLRSGCPPWLGSQVVARGTTLLGALNPEDILLLSLGIPPLHGPMRNIGDQRITMVLAACEEGQGVTGRGVRTLCYLPHRGKHLYYCIRPEIHAQGKRVVEGDDFFVFGQSGRLQIEGNIATPENSRGYRGLGLIAGSLGFFSKATYAEKRPGTKTR